MNNGLPTFFRVFFVHHHITSLIGIPFSVVYIVLIRIYLKPQPFVLPLGIFGVFITLLVLGLSTYKRYLNVRALIEQGYVLKGKVIGNRQGYLLYEYKSRGQIYRASERLVVSRAIRKLAIGQEVNVFADYQDPKRSVLSELYE